MTPPPRLSYSYREVAAMTGLGLNTIKRRVAEGAIQARRSEGRVLITADEVRRYLASLEPVVPSKNMDQS